MKPLVPTERCTRCAACYLLTSGFKYSGEYSTYNSRYHISHLVPRSHPPPPRLRPCCASTNSDCYDYLVAVFFMAAVRPPNELGTENQASRVAVSKRTTKCTRTVQLEYCPYAYHDLTRAYLERRTCYRPRDRSHFTNADMHRRLCVRALLSFTFHVSTDITFPVAYRQKSKRSPTDTSSPSK